MRATVTIAGMSVNHILVTPTELDPLQRSFSHTEQCSGASPTTVQALSFAPEREHERVNCLIPLTVLKKKKKIH